MYLVPFGRWTTGLLAVLALIALPRPSLAQNKPEKVKFETFDDVELHGNFYASLKGPQSPCVILLHPTGSDRLKAGLEAVARRFQGDYSVLTFDFRGHGDSENVLAKFWAHRLNQQLKGAKPNKPTISYKEFPNSYWPMLVNDIAAAKRYLDRRTDANQCNSSNVILMGADDAAALGQLYLATAWRPQYGAFQPASTLSGNDIACAVWAGMPQNVRGNSLTSMAQWVAQTPQMAKTPICCLYVENDNRARSVALNLDKALKQTRQASKLSTHIAIKDRAASRDLLKRPQGEETVLKFLAKVFDDRGISAPQRKDIDRLMALEVDLRPFLAGR
jgi:pimeloyl-ACP methyl ester carboxylesterase